MLGDVKALLEAILYWEPELVGSRDPSLAGSAGAAADRSTIPILEADVLEVASSHRLLFRDHARLLGEGGV